MKVSRSLKVAVAALAAVAFAAPSAFAAVTITAGGSSFDAPILNACKVDWQTSTGNTFTYTSSDSGTGQKNEDAGIFDSNFSDSSYTPKASTVLQIPIVMAPIAVIVNLPGHKDVYLSQQSLSDIFAGVVTKWNDPEIQADNSGTVPVTHTVQLPGGKTQTKVVNTSRYYTLPNQPIHIVARADSSGTTKNFITLFKTQFPTVWTKALDKTFANDFPGSINGAGNIGRIQTASGSTGVAALLAKTPYSIGYAETSYVTGSLRAALIGNANGEYVGPTAGATAAFVGAASIVNGGYKFDYSTKASGAYVLGIVSYALVDSAKTGANAAATTSFIKYVLSSACSTSAGAVKGGFAQITGAVLDYDNSLIAKLPTA
jgi:phosphate transport system substrate-binding protein